VLSATPAWAGEPSAPPCRERPVPGVGRVITGTVESFGRLPSRQTAFWFAAGSFGALGAHQFDESTSRRLGTSEHAHELLAPGGIIGGAAAQIGAGIATYALGRASGNHCAGAVGADLIRAHLVAEAITLAFKATVRRERPDGGQFSFPSGHASVTFATATVLHRQFGWKAGVPAYAMASYVALSRIQARRHYLSDVIFGAAVGIASGYAAVPVIGRRTAGVMLVWSH
jgi:membrane-associated phospholipid phosphatase